MSAHRTVFMNLVYLDDSCDADFQMIGAVVVPENQFMLIESYLVHTMEELVPEEQRERFEFHASAMFHGKEPFNNLGRDRVMEIFRCCASIVTETPIPIVFGAVDTKNLKQMIYASARPIDIAFRTCAFGLGGWFFEHVNGQMGIFICDNNEKPNVKSEMQSSFRAYRRRLRSDKEERGILDRVHDDMYFGDSAYSVGIQLADICSYIILRHLQGKQDTEHLYKTIEPHIFFGLVEPNGKPMGNAVALSDPANKTTWVDTMRR